MSYVWLTWLADALRGEGCQVTEEAGWTSRGRPASTGAFNPYGVLWHHTGTHASSSDPAPSLHTVINGRSDLPGPLCQVLIDYSGVCHVVAAGRANHAGQCGGFGPFPPGDGNAQLVGFEIDYDGTQPMSSAQRDAATRASAACLRRFSKGSGNAARHAETSTTGKWDTGGVTGDQLRSMIATYMSSGGDDDVVTDDDINRIIKQLLNTKLGSSGPTVAVALQGTYQWGPGAAWLSAKLGTSGPTTGVAWQSGYNYAKKTAESLDIASGVTSESQSAAGPAPEHPQ
jgi:hypothetical protein